MITTLKARFVVPVEAPVISDGAVAFEDGLITAVGRSRDVTIGEQVDFGDAVIVPGFVNAHTHLELSLLTGRVPPTSDFADWIRRLAEVLKAESTPTTVEAAMRNGIRDSLAAGVTAVGDITRLPTVTRPILASSALRGVSYGEVIAVGKIRHMLEERLDAAADTFFDTDHVGSGVSPHSPYTVEPHGLSRCAARANAAGLPLCIHLSETLDEDAFTTSRAGCLAQLLHTLGVWDEDVPIAGCRPVALAKRCGLLTPRTILAHANYVTDEDMTEIAKAQSSVAYCPRTHRAFGHAPHRFQEMLRAGVNVCVGTDSLASNPGLSLLDELRFLHRTYPHLPVESLLAMGTIRGARALGLDGLIGSLDRGKVANLVVLKLSGARGTWDSILESEDGPIAVYVDGRAYSPNSGS